MLQLQIQRLTDALMKLKDLSVMEKKESEKKIRQLERENDSIPVLEEKIVKLKDDVKKANEKIEQLKEQLDVALEAEDMVEELSDKKLELEEVTHLVSCPIVSSLLLDRTQTHTMDLSSECSKCKSCSRLWKTWSSSSKSARSSRRTTPRWRSSSGPLCVRCVSHPLSRCAPIIYWICLFSLSHTRARLLLATIIITDKKEIQYLESLTKIKNQQGEIEDREKTIDQFREKVNSLQLHVKQYEEKEEGLASEARQLSTKSQALLDQNIQLKVESLYPQRLLLSA